MSELSQKMGNYRYRILALMFMATTINYFDRSIVGVMAPTLQKLFDWSNKDYAAIMVSFKIAYGIGLLFMGNIKEEIQCFYKMKGTERTILVSDMVDLAGLPPGEYIREEKLVVLTADVVKFPAENCSAGAASTIVSGVSNIMKFTHCSLSNAIQMASKNPARAIGLNDVGELKQGKRADLILFTIEDGKIVIQKTIVAGKIVYSI